jgi:hypothetical protein
MMIEGRIEYHRTDGLCLFRVLWRCEYVVLMHNTTAIPLWKWQDNEEYDIGYPVLEIVTSDPIKVANL